MPGTGRKATAAKARRKRERRDGLPSSERVYRELKNAIVAGKFPPRTRLVEVQVAEDLGVSRTPVREALKRLLVEEYLSRDPLGGLVVHAVSPSEVEEAYFVCRGLDGLAANLAAQRISPDELVKLRVIHATMGEAIAAGRTEEAVAANVAFHDTIYAIAGNTRLSDIARTLRDFVRRFSSEAFTVVPDRTTETLEEHAKIIAALEATDAKAAEAAARSHLDGAHAHLPELHAEALLRSLGN
jgi:DNA-binding GntR family transcriptional regulator